jgi:uncharacterized protein YbgA (DUF1722 family)
MQFLHRAIPQDAELMSIRLVSRAFPTLNLKKNQQGVEMQGRVFSVFHQKSRKCFLHDYQSIMTVLREHCVKRRKMINVRSIVEAYRNCGIS